MFTPKNFLKPQDNIFLIATEKISFLQLVSQENFNIFFFNIFSLNASCGYEGTKAFIEHYGRDDLQKWSQNISRQNAKWSIPYSGHIMFLEEPLFFLIQDRVHERKALFYLKIFLCKNFHQFDKCPGKHTSNTRQVETKPVCK